MDSGSLGWQPKAMVGETWNDPQQLHSNKLCPGPGPAHRAPAPRLCPQDSFPRVLGPPRSFGQDSSSKSQRKVARQCSTSEGDLINARPLSRVSLFLQEFSSSTEGTKVWVGCREEFRPQGRVAAWGWECWSVPRSLRQTPPSVKL